MGKVSLQKTDSVSLKPGKGIFQTIYNNQYTRTYSTNSLEQIQ